MATNLFDYFEELSQSGGAGPHWAARTPLRPSERFDMKLVPRSPNWRDEPASLQALERVEREPWVDRLVRNETSVELRLDDRWIERLGADLQDGECAEQELSDRGISSETRVMSAHREPDVVSDYARNAKLRGIKVIIAGAGLSAALPGVVAAHTELPVIGVPLTSRTSVAGGLDALLSISQMPPGVPVACVGVDNARNAAVLAARILSI